MSAVICIYAAGYFLWTVYMRDRTSESGAPEEQKGRLLSLRRDLYHAIALYWVLLLVNMLVLSRPDTTLSINVALPASVWSSSVCHAIALYWVLLLVSMLVWSRPDTTLSINVALPASVWSSSVCLKHRLSHSTCRMPFSKPITREQGSSDLPTSVGTAHAALYLQ